MAAPSSKQLVIFSPESYHARTEDYQFVGSAQRRGHALKNVSVGTSVPVSGNSPHQPGSFDGMKFTTLIPTTRNDGMAVKPSVLERLIDSLWRPFRGVTREGLVTGHWIDDDGTEFSDLCVKIS